MPKSPLATFFDANRLRLIFGSVLLIRLLYPFFDSPLEHLFSDPLRHWGNGGRFLDPDILGCNDPFLFQFWLYALRHLAHDRSPSILLGCGFLCAAMPYGWYRALREVQSRERAFAGATLIALLPDSFGLYAYFMTETLLVALFGFCFWLTLRSHRKGTLGAFALAAAVWWCAAFTRTVAVPMAVGCIGWLLLTQSHRFNKAVVAILLGLALAIPAGLHATSRLGFFAPFGNLYFNEIYSVSGKREIQIDYGPDGHYHFGAPSFYNPTFYPFSDWTTARSGVAAVNIDLTKGRADWIAEKQRMARERTFPAGQQRWENFLYTFFAQTWPNSDRNEFWGWLTLWTRWLWAPLTGLVLWAFLRGRYRTPDFLLPLCALGTITLLLVQREAVMESRFREPIDGILVASVLILGTRGRKTKSMPATNAAFRPSD